MIDIESVNIDDVIYLFENIVFDEIKKLVWIVDVLIGYGYVRYYFELE